eukprot:COSAG03_NODE_14149_length_475_cov_0.779255_1_plen_97_part_01
MLRRFGRDETAVRACVWRARGRAVREQPLAGRQALAAGKRRGGPTCVPPAPLLERGGWVTARGVAMPFRGNVEFEPRPIPDLKAGTEVWACRFTGEV